MPQPHKRHLLTKIILLGGLFAGLVYFFHPEVGGVSLLIDGQPVAEPLFRLAAIPLLLAVVAVVGVLVLIALFGAGMLMFFAVLACSVLGVFLLAPYSWPILLLFGLMLLAMSWRSGGER
ncbi:hypothetical protein A1507_03215 [Methylomonas koyamae]|uniref:Uncharacterized protein n=1 Tax=Methylomonas koyamae TaxID=702114 RepID=A0A177N5U4_9GAMM|nr:hypothetical protein [Methylomonas koyamae]OAI12500.1 hypothetical protein A1507_03215 [Methylomonas koyamae]